VIIVQLKVERLDLYVLIKLEQFVVEYLSHINFL